MSKIAGKENRRKQKQNRLIPIYNLLENTWRKDNGVWNMHKFFQQDGADEWIGANYSYSNVYLPFSQIQ